MIKKVLKYFSKKTIEEKRYEEEWYIVRPYKNDVPIKLFKFYGYFSKYYLDLSEKNGYCYIMNFDNKPPKGFYLILCK